MKIDLHCHSYYSKDGLSSPEKLIKTALRKGLDGIALTDHDTIQGLKEAEKAAEKLNGKIILGEEIKVKKNGKIIGDVIGIFLKKEIKSKEVIEVMKEIKAQGGIVILPHPFHHFENFKDDLTKYLDFIDAIEVFNARLPFSFFDKKALNFAKKYNLAIVAGSDAHYQSAVGDAFTIGENITNLEEFKVAILNKKVQIFGRKSPFFSLIFPTLAKFKKLVNSL